MTEERIVRSMLVSAALALGVAGCPPETPNDSDAGVGGSSTGGTTAMGGMATGGSATGGTAPVPVCATVASLPAMDTACNTLGESRCDPSGNQCVCEGGERRWHCSTICTSTYPTEPAVGSACIHGAACNYPSGVSCECDNHSQWVCIGTAYCPADMPTTGQACNGLTSVLCDYPNHDPHVACFCSPNADASTGSTWTCIQVAPCPATQPPCGTACSGPAICSYSSPPRYWVCLQSSGSEWVCL